MLFLSDSESLAQGFASVSPIYLPQDKPLLDIDTKMVHPNTKTSTQVCSLPFYSQ